MLKAPLLANVVLNELVDKLTVGNIQNAQAVQAILRG